MREFTLQNDMLRLAVRPDLGARIDSLLDLTTGKEWVWHRPGHLAAPRYLPIGAPFDANWEGGWDDIFPNDGSGSFMERELPDHGELWSQEWRIGGYGSRKMTMRYRCKTSPFAVEKKLSLDPGERGFALSYTFENLSGEQLPFLFKLHPAIAIDPGDEVLLPSCLIEPVELGFSTIIGKPGKTPFPGAFSASGEQVRLDRVPGPEANAQEFFYAQELAEGWCGVRNSRTASTLRLKFTTADFPYVWVFQSYGRFFGHFVLILEPCTNIPYDLGKAVENGTCAMLKPYETRKMSVEVAIEG